MTKTHISLIHVKMPGFRTGWKDDALASTKQHHGSFGSEARPPPWQGLGRAPEFASLCSHQLKKSAPETFTV